MKNKILIVESPNKVYALKEILKDFEVYSSKGYINALIGYDENFNCKKVLQPNGKLLLNQLLKHKKDHEFYLATDADREGEGIAYDIYNLLISNNYINIKRVIFREITSKAILFAINNTINIDFNLVDSQQSRAIADLMIGFGISELMSKYIAPITGTGRVQAPALNLIYQKTQERKKFLSVCNYEINVHFLTKELERKFTLEKQLFSIKQTCLDFISNIKDINFKRSKYEEKQITDNNLLPFKTTVLIKKAESLFGFSPDKTMKIAQSLFEGKKLQDKIVGLITYLRTDSVRVSEEFLQQNIDFIASLGKVSITHLNLVSDNKLNIQDAHECIRPTNLKLTPESIATFLSEDENKIYNLIYNFFLASCIEPPQYLNIKTEFINNDKLSFKMSHQIIQNKGYLFSDFNFKYLNKEDINTLVFSEILIASCFSLKEKKTLPPSLYSSATLIEKLENLGIGRPSSYATLTSKLIQKNFILNTIDNKLQSTELGDFAHIELEKFFYEIFKFEFTSDLEVKLDDIAKKKIDKKTILIELKNILDKLLLLFNEYIKKILSTKLNCLYCNTTGLIIKKKFVDIMLLCKNCNKISAFYFTHINDQCITFKKKFNFKLPRVLFWCLICQKLQLALLSTFNKITCKDCQKVILIYYLDFYKKSFFAQPNYIMIISNKHIKS